MKKAVSKALELLIRAAITAAATMPLAKSLIDAAFQERGYSAFGGEWLMIIIMTAVLWKLSGFIFSSPESTKKKVRKKYRENGIERAYAQHSGCGSSAVFDNQKLELDEMGQAESVPQRDRRA